MQIYATITGDKEVQQKLKLLMQKCEDKVIDIVKIATIKTEAEAKKAAPVALSRLRNSITHELINKQKEHSGKVGTNVKYSKYVEFGTRPHLAPISAEYARKYGIPVPKGKDYVMVKVSGKAHPFLYPALKIGIELLKSKLQNEIKKITV